jgi:hypothetical protein
MTFFRVALTATMFAGLVATAPAQAAVVFSQQPTGFIATAINNPSGGNPQNFLNQFSLGASTNLNGFDLRSLMPAGLVRVGQSVTIKLRSSAAGNPAATNLFSFNTTVSSITDNYLHADFSNILLGAGTYFIGMSGNGFNIGEDLFSDNSIPNKLVQLSGDAIPVRIGFVSAFRVYGETATAAVPEPATWAMMLVGFGGIGFAMRRKSNVTTKVAYA